MSKRGPPRGLSIVVDASHRNITDDSDRCPTGRIILHEDDHVADGQDLLIDNQQSSASSGSGGQLESKRSSRNTKQLSLNLGSAGSSRSSVPPWEKNSSVPPSPAVQLPALTLSSTTEPSMTNSNSLSTFPPPSSLAARRRSSIVSLPANGHSLQPRQRNDSVTSLASVQYRAASITSARGGTRAEEDGYGYSTAALTAGLVAPAPYAHGPIQIMPGVWLGCEDNAREWPALKRCGIGSILNVAKEIKNLMGDEDFSGNEPSTSNTLQIPITQHTRTSPIRTSTSTPDFKQQKSQVSSSIGSSKPVPKFYPADPSIGRPAINYLHLPWSHGQADLVSSGFPIAFEFVDDSIRRGKGVLIHCQCGVSRSATLVIALVMRASIRKDVIDELKEIRGSMHAAYAFVKEKSVAVGPNMSLIYQLLEYERHLSMRSRKRSSHRAPSEAGSTSVVSMSNQDDTSDESQQHKRATDEEDQGALSHDDEFDGLDEAERLKILEEREAERIRLEEEEWGRMRKQLEEEEEREREESLRSASASAVASNNGGFGFYGSQAPWSSDIRSQPNMWNPTWKGFGAARGSSTGMPSADDDDEARDLDRAMEERMSVRRKSSIASIASSAASGASLSSGSANGNASGVVFPALGGGSGGMTAGSGSSWKGRFGSRRLRAGSVESNFTGRSMVSLEEEEEEEEEEPEKRAQEVSSPDQMKLELGRDRARTISAQPADLSDAASAHGSSEDEKASNGSARGKGEVELELPPLVHPGPLSDGTTTDSAAVVTPVTPMSLVLPKRKPQKQLKQKERMEEEEDVGEVTIVVEDATPMVSRRYTSDGEMDFSSRGGRRPSVFHSIPPPSASIHKLSFGASDIAPPASASIHKLSFGASDLAPPPSASIRKTSFGESELALPPPSASVFKTSFGTSDLAIPSSSSRRGSATSSNGSEAKSIEGSTKQLRLPLKKPKRHNIPPPLATVPPSPPATFSSMRPKTPMVTVFSPTTPMGKRPEPPSRSTATVVDLGLISDAESVKTDDEAGSDVEIEVTVLEQQQPPSITARKRTKSRPVPQPLELRNDSSDTKSAYILTNSSAHRSSSSVSSVGSSSSNSSSGSIRNKLLSRVVGGNPSSSVASTSAVLPSTATPHQTLFIFPPSPKNRTTFGPNGERTQTLPSLTPSTLTVTTTTPHAPNAFDNGGASVATPTPTLANFRFLTRRASGASGRGGSTAPAPFPTGATNSVAWPTTNANPVAPTTTACSRVDARGWIGL
ncbi:hypothetical protein FRC03_000189 [Tulasnella sp. 419]|nr:hypothetical protein FRC03_000189 [Tulasnella sp. 419]